MLGTVGDPLFGVSAIIIFLLWIRGGLPNGVGWVIVGVWTLFPALIVGLLAAIVTGTLPKSAGGSGYSDSLYSDARTSGGR